MGKKSSFRKFLVAALAAVLVIPPSLSSLVSEPVAATASDVINEYVALTPARLLDTRPGQTTIDNLFAQTGRISAGQIFDLQVLGRGGVPITGVSAVALNVTVTEPTNSSFLSVFPKGEAIPNASNLNFVPGQTAPNMVIAKVGADGSISIRNGTGAVHVIVDIAGWYAQGGTYSALTPARLLDTRPGQTTIDNLFAQSGRISAGQIFDLQVLGRGGVPASGVSAVALNVTVTDPTAESFLSVFPKGEAIPNTSNLNFTPGQTIPNMVISKVGADGSISIRNGTGAVHVIVDIAGWFAQDGAYSALSPSRLMDSRAGQATIDNRFAREGRINSGQIYHLQVLGRGGVPATGVSAVAVNVTVTDPSANSFLSVFPKGEAIPNASNLNFTPGQTVPNMVIAKVGADGSISIRNGTGAAYVIVDIAGWYASPRVRVPQVLPQNTLSPTLSGNLAPGFVITANPGTWTGSPTPTYTYNWLRCTSQVMAASVTAPANCSTIPGQTGPTYTLTFDDANRFIVAEVSGTNSAGSTSFWTTSTALVAQQTNLNLVLAPVMTGNGSQGSGLSVTSGQWFGDPTITYSWMRCDSRVGSLTVSEPAGCVTIANQTSPTYTISQADAGRFVLAKVTATNLTGSQSVWTSSTQTSNPANTVDPAISGSATNLSTLTANVGTWQGFPIPTYTYQWFECTTQVFAAARTIDVPLGCIEIPSSTSRTLAPVSNSRLGKFILVRVNAYNANGSATVFSASTEAVTAAPLATVNPTVSGTRSNGETLTVSEGTWISYPAEMTTSHQWFRCTSSVTLAAASLPSQCSEIPGEVSTTYTQTTADAGRFITARTSRTNTIGTTNFWSVAITATTQLPTLMEAPTISGSAAFGSTLTASPGTWQGFPIPTYTYQWFECTNQVLAAASTLDSSCTQIASSTTTTRSLGVTSLIGKYILVRVVATNSIGTTTQFTASTEIVSSAPRPTASLQLIGTRSVGNVLSVSMAEWIAYPATMSDPVYSWFRCTSQSYEASSCSEIIGENSSLYTQTSSDAGRYLVASVTRENETGSLTHFANSFFPTSERVLLFSAPALPSSITLGASLSVGEGSWRGFPLPTLDYEWFECSVVVNSASDALPENCEEVMSVQSMDMGVSHNCALMSTGSIQCWGLNSSGQLGDGTTTTRSAPVQVSGVSTAISLSAGSDHSCSILDDGQVSCWGEGSLGRLGNGSTADRLAPISVSLNASALEISAGKEHTCAVLATGQVHCWGAGGSGRLGNGATSNQSTPVSAWGINSAIAVSAGGSHTCAVLRDGTVWCWGANSDGQLGDLTYVSKSSPVQASGISGAVSVSAGLNHTCAVLSNNEVMCWGAGMAYQGIDPSGCIAISANCFTSTSRPRLIGPLATNWGDWRPSVQPIRVNSLSAGDEHTCASLTSGGSSGGLPGGVLCWGRGALGQLGSNQTVDRGYTLVYASGVSSSVAVYSGGNKTCSLLESGQITCWGQLSSGVQLVPLVNTNFHPTRTSSLIVSNNHAGKHLIAKVTARNTLNEVSVYTASTRVVQ
jgi:alpha-tubulin suppressor-like RCC1 family protein/type IV secretory pathway TrbD component